MTLKTDFKDEILEDGKQYREFDLVSQTGDVIQTNVHLVRKDVPQQEGDNYGSKEINELNEEVNNKLSNTYVPTWSSITNKPSSYPSTWGSVSGKPTTFPPSTHTHNDIYHPKTQWAIVNLEIASSGSSSVSYPSGFTQTNCDVIAIGEMNSKTNLWSYGTGAYVTLNKYSLDFYSSNALNYSSGRITLMKR